MEEGKIQLTPAKFLVCVDDTEHARSALRFACSKAKKLGGVVAILHIIDSSDFQNFLLAPGKMREEKSSEGNTLLDKLAAEVTEQYHMEVQKILKSGVIGEKIVETVEEDLNYNMLVVGAAPDGSGRTRKLIPWLTSQLGSRLLIPIMIVPGNLTDQQILQLS